MRSVHFGTGANEQEWNSSPIVGNPMYYEQSSVSLFSSCLSSKYTLDVQGTSVSKKFSEIWEERGMFIPDSFTSVSQ